MRLIVGLLNLLISRITEVPRIEAVPGKTTITLTREGLPMATVVLRELRWDSRDGASAQFVDASQYMEARRVR